MKTERDMEKVFRKFNIDSQPTDFAYWQNQPYEKRLAALEEILKKPDLRLPISTGRFLTGQARSF